MSILEDSAIELSKKIKAGEVLVTQALEAVLERIDAVENQVNSYMTIDRDQLMKKAEEIQKKIDSKELTGPFAGVPIAIKDNICTKGLLTTCSSKILSNFIPGYSAEAVLDLESAGALIIGKTNMDEFAMGSTTETNGIWIMYREDLLVDQRLLLQLENVLQHSVLIRVDPSDSQPLFVE